MTKIKLANGTIVNATYVELVNGILKITTTDFTVEELAELFTDKNNTSLIVLMTEAEEESGNKKGFTSFAGISYGKDGAKTVELFQPADTTEARIANAEAAVIETNQKIAELKGENQLLTDCILEMSALLYT